MKPGLTVRMPMPALLTRTSRPPRAEIACPTPAETILSIADVHGEPGHPGPAGDPGGRVLGARLGPAGQGDPGTGLRQRLAHGEAEPARSPVTSTGTPSRSGAVRASEGSVTRLTIPCSGREPPHPTFRGSRCWLRYPRPVKIAVDDLSGPQIARFLDEHVQQMRSITPPESKHALDLDALRTPDITFWSVMDSGAIVGCGAHSRDWTRATPR